MVVIELNDDDITEPVWDSVGMRRCDFRPHFEGDVVNLSTAILPAKTLQESARQFQEVASEIALWVLEHRNRFSLGDKFQIIVGWPLQVRSTDRQVIKALGTLEEIQQVVDDPSMFVLRDGWDAKVFD